MRLEVCGPYCTKVSVGDSTLLFSYNTPVGFFDGIGWYVREQINEEPLSRTTSKHISQNTFNPKIVSESVFHSILKTFD